MASADAAMAFSTMWLFLVGCGGWLMDQECTAVVGEVIHS